MLAKARAAKAEALDPDGIERPENCPAADWAWDLVNDLLRLSGSLGFQHVDSVLPCPVAPLAEQLREAYELLWEDEHEGEQDRFSLRQAAALDRIAALMKLASVNQATSLRGAAVQVLAAAEYAGHLLALDGQDTEDLARTILRLMFSIHTVLQAIPAAALPPDAVYDVLGDYRNPFLSAAQRAEALQDRLNADKNA